MKRIEEKVEACAAVMTRGMVYHGATEYIHGAEEGGTPCSCGLLSHVEDHEGRCYKSVFDLSRWETCSD